MTVFIHKYAWSTSTQLKKLNLLTLFLFLLLPQIGHSEEDNRQAIDIQRIKSSEQLNASVMKALESLQVDSPNVSIRHRADRVGPALLLNLDLRLDGQTAKAQALNFINRYQGLWGKLNISIDKVERRRQRDIVHLVGTIHGVQIINQQSKLSIINGTVQHLSNGIGAIDNLLTAKISQEEAQESVLKTIGGQGLKVYNIKKVAVSYEPGIAHEVYELRVIHPKKLLSWIVRLDGLDGAIISIVAGEKN